MKNSIVKIILVLVVVTVSFSCENTSYDVDLSPEMETILKDIENTDVSTSESLTRYSDSIKVTDHTICYYNLKKPQVTNVENNCYTVRFKSGVTVREYVFVWQENKIVEIVDNGVVG